MRVAVPVGSRWAARWPFALLLAVYALTLLGLDQRGFWIADNAGKFLQLQAVVAGGYVDYSLPWPGRAIDPAFEFNPLPAPFSRVREGRLFSQYPPAFALVSSPFYRWFGPRGLALLPLLCTVAALAGVGALAREATADGGAGRTAPLIAGLGTPVWFYAVEFWEHAIVVGLGVWSARFALRYRRGGSERDLAVASLLLAGSAWFREEMLLFGAVLLGLALLGARRRRRAAVVVTTSLLAGLVPLLIFQGWALGAPFGVHVRSNLSTLAAHVAARPAVAHRLFLAAGPETWWTLLTGLLVLGLLWSPRLSPRAFRLALPACGLAAVGLALATLRGVAVSPGPIAHLLASNSLFPAAPVLALALVRVREDGRSDPGARLLDDLRLVAVGFAGLYALLAPAVATAGIHWGNRFLLLLYPLLAVLAAANLERWRRSVASGRAWLAVPLLAALLVSCAAQVYSVRLLRTKRDFTARLNLELARHPERVVVTDVWWAPQEMYTAFFDRAVFFVHTRAQLEDLAQRLRRTGHERYLSVARAGSRLAPDAVTVDDGGLRFFSLELVGRDL